MVSSQSASRYLPTTTESRFAKRLLYTQFIAALLTIAKICVFYLPSVVEWISNMWYIHTMECSSAFKRKEILTHATTWINLENIMLSEISQSQKHKCYDSTYMRYLE